MSDESVWWPERRKGLARFLDEGELARFHAVTEVATVAAGAVVLHKGAPSRSVLLIEAGELHVIEEQLGEPRVLAVMGPGDVAGELGFVDDWPRTQDVRAGTECRLRRLTREKLVGLATSEPVVFGKVVTGLAVILADRFREVAAELAPVRGFAASLDEPMEVADPPEGGASGALQSRHEDDMYDAVDAGDTDAAVDMLRQIMEKARRGFAGL